jgi:hypothetical protein
VGAPSLNWRACPCTSRWKFLDVEEVRGLQVLVEIRTPVSTVVVSMVTSTVPALCVAVEHDAATGGC